MNELPDVIQIAAEVVGREPALALARRLAGTRPRWPADVDRLIRDSRIKKAWENSGESASSLARRFDLSERQVRRILRQQKAGNEV